MSDKRTITHQVGLADNQYDGIMSEIMKMKPNKRKNYKTTIRGKTGMLTKVRYVDGKLKNYSHLVHKMVDVVKQSEVFKQEGWKPASAVGYKITLVEEFMKELKNIIVADDTGIIMNDEERDEWINDRRSNLTCRVLNDAVAENHTGNSYRNHTIHINKQGRNSSQAF